VEQWSIANRMEFGISKCAVQPIFKQHRTGEKREAEIQKIRDGVGKKFTIYEEQIPITEKYTHLGNIVNSNLTGTDTKKMRKQKGKARLGTLRKFLHSNNTIALWRKTVVQAVIPSSLLYASELWLYEFCDAKDMQKIYNDAVKCARRWGRGSPTHPLMLEADLKHLGVIGLRKQVRTLVDLANRDPNTYM